MDSTVKVTVAPDGAITIDTNNPGLAVELVNVLRNSTPLTKFYDDMQSVTENAANIPGLPKPKRKRGRPRKKTGTKPDQGQTMSPQLVAVRDFLATHGDVDGATPALLAAELGITPVAAAWRLNRLTEKGAATKIRHGHYKAVTS